MIKSVLKAVFLNLFAFYTASLILSGILVFSDLKSFIVGVLFVSLANIVIRPLVNLLLLPFHLISFGLFRWLANFVVIYLLVSYVPGIHLYGFIWPNPPIAFSFFSSLLICTLLISFIYFFFNWLFSD